MTTRFKVAILLAAALAAPSIAGAQTKALSCAMVQVFGASPITVAPTRDSEVMIFTNEGGRVEIDFDELTEGGNPANDTGASLELDLIVNGVPDPRVVPFDIVDGQINVEVHLGLSTNDLVDVERIDVFDSNHDRFATLGVRIQSP